MIRHSRSRSRSTESCIDRAARVTIEGLESRQMLAAHIVGNATNYTTIQAAINAASAGATITVDAGTYTEAITVNKSLTIKGAKAGLDARTRGTSGESILTGVNGGTAGVGRALYIAANNVTIDGFTIQGTTNKSTSVGAGVVVGPGQFGMRFVNNVVKNNVSGMFLANASATTPAVIQFNLFKDNNNAGLNGGRGIYTDGGISGGLIQNVTIDSNTFSNNRGGSGTTSLEAAVAFEAAGAGKQTNIRITNNTFSSNGKSVLFFNTTNVLIQGNTCQGALDWYSGSLRFEGNNQNVQILNNNIINNPGPGVAVDSNGVQGNSSGFVVKFNNISGNGTNSNYGTTKLGVVYNQSVYTGTFDASNNWWGNANGPRGDGPGTGDGIYGNAYKTVYWHVTKGSGSVYSPWSTSTNTVGVPVVTLPGIPSGLSASATSATQINLTWALGSGTATNIFVERSIDGTNFTARATLAGNATSYSDTGLSPATKYYYRVFAANSAGNSNPSAVANATTQNIAGTTYLSDLNWSSATTGYGSIFKDKSMAGNVLTIGGVQYSKGIGVHAVSALTYNLGGVYSTFSSDIGIDNEVDAKGQGKVQFLVIGDGVTLYDSGVMSNGQVKKINISVAGVQTLVLRAVNGIANNIDYDHADWAGALLTAGAPVAPNAPTGLVASVVSSSQLKLTWTAGPANLTGYQIDRSTDGTNFVPVANTLAGSATTFTDSGLVASTKYYYRIRAVNSVGPSANSSIVNATTQAAGVTTTFMSDLTPTAATTGYGTIGKDVTVKNLPITLNGVVYAKGIGAHAVSSITFNLGGNYSAFLSDVGVDDEVNPKGIGTVQFKVIGDGVTLYDSGIVSNGVPPKSINISVAGVQTLTLLADNGGDDIDYDHADWAGARLLSSSAPAATFAAAPSSSTTTTTSKTTSAASMLKTDLTVL